MENERNAYLLVYRRKLRTSENGEEASTTVAEPVVPPQISDVITADNNAFNFDRQVWHSAFFEFIADIIGSLVPPEAALVVQAQSAAAEARSKAEAAAEKAAAGPKPSNVVRYDDEKVEEAEKKDGGEGSPLSAVPSLPLQGVSLPESAVAVVPLLMEAGTRFVWDVLAHARDGAASLRVLASHLKALYCCPQAAPAAEALLQGASAEVLCEALLRCSNEYVREQLSQLYGQALRCLAAAHRGKYGDSQPVALEGPQPTEAREAAPSKEDKGDKRDEEAAGQEAGPLRFQPTSEVVRFVDTLMELLPLVPVNWTRYTQYWQLLLSFAELGRQESVLLLERGLLVQVRHCHT
jgi:hypothetical protein